MGIRPRRKLRVRQYPTDRAGVHLSSSLQWHPEPTSLGVLDLAGDIAKLPEGDTIGVS